MLLYKKLLFFALITVLAPFSPIFGDDKFVFEKKIEEFFNSVDCCGLSLIYVDADPKRDIRKIYSHGKHSRRSEVDINSHTEFRLGVLSQMFIAATLSYLVYEGQVSYSDPISKFLPKTVKTPTYDGHEITLLDLATHSSGLPNLSQTAWNWSDLNASHIYKFLSSTSLKQRPGSKFEHSNIGYALLGNIISRITRKPIDSCIQRFILQPFGLSDSTFFLSTEQKSRLSIGYEQDKGVPPSLGKNSFSIFNKSLGLYSTPRDMLTFLEYMLGIRITSLNSVLREIETPKKEFDKFSAGLGCKIYTQKNNNLEIITLKGSFFGFFSQITLIPSQNKGLVILANKFDLDPNDLVNGLLNIDIPN